MDASERVLARLRRIDALEEERAPAAALLAEVRALLREAEEWVAGEGDERARAAVERLDASLADVSAPAVAG